MKSNPNTSSSITVVDKCKKCDGLFDKDCERLKINELNKEHNKFEYTDTDFCVDCVFQCGDCDDVCDVYEENTCKKCEKNLCELCYSCHDGIDCI